MNYVDGEDVEQIDSYIAIATSDSQETNEMGGGMDLVIVHLRQQSNQNQNESIASVRSVMQGVWNHVCTRTLPALHAMVITQVVALTDYENRLQFVTVSFDCHIKVIEIEEKGDEFETSISHVILSNGQIINALPL